MKAADYINTLIKERDELKELCKSHVEKIRLFKKDLIKKDKKIQKLESEIKSPNENIKNELVSFNNELILLKQKYNDLKKNYNDLKQKCSKKGSNKVNIELNTLKEEYKELQKKYNFVLAENEEYKRIFDDVENECDSN